jgi:hypothetical protein
VHSLSAWMSPMSTSKTLKGIQETGHVPPI